MKSQPTDNKIEIRKPQPSGRFKEVGKPCPEPLPADVLELEHELFLTPVQKEIVDTLLYVLTNGKDLGYLKLKGVILHGPPGVGKTSLIKHVVQEYRKKMEKKGEGSEPYILVYQIPPDATSTYISQVFEEARKNAKDKPVIILIDEIDSFGQKEYNRYTRGLGPISMLLTEIDGIERNPNLLVVGITNYIDGVDHRLMRSGRFDRTFEVSLPDRRTREEIIRIHARSNNPEVNPNPHNFEIPEELVPYIAEKTFGYTPADLKSFISDLLIHCGLHGKRVVTREDVDAVLKKFKPTLARDLLGWTEPTLKLDDLILEEEWKNVLLDYIKNGSGLKILFYGPPGCGKTTIAEAIAGTRGYRMIRENAAGLQEGIVGETQKRIREIFERANSLRPIVVVLDNIEGLVVLQGERSYKIDETKFLNSYLSRNVRDDVIVIATCGNPLAINEETRSLFDLWFIGYPSEEQIDEWLRRNGLVEVLTPQDLTGYSFRDLENLSKVIEYGERRGIPLEERVDRFLRKYVPQGRKDSLNWNAVVKTVGDYASIYKMLEEGE